MGNKVDGWGVGEVVVVWELEVCTEDDLWEVEDKALCSEVDVWGVEDVGVGNEVDGWGVEEVGSEGVSNEGDG